MHAGNRSGRSTQLEDKRLEHIRYHEHIRRSGGRLREWCAQDKDGQPLCLSTAQEIGKVAHGTIDVGAKLWVPRPECEIIRALRGMGALGYNACCCVGGDSTRLRTATPRWRRASKVSSG